MKYRFVSLKFVLASFLIGAVGQMAVAQDGGAYAVVDNGEFSVEFLEYEYLPNNNWVVLYYEVCKLGEGPEVKNLSHWSIELYSFAHCLKNGCTPDDLIPICAQTAPFAAGEEPGEYILEGTDDPDAPQCVIGIDPTTGIAGLKFDDLQVGDGECQRYAFVLDLNCLRNDHKIASGFVEVATKAGHQDIRKTDVPDPGYAEIQGPVCVSR